MRTSNLFRNRRRAAAGALALGVLLVSSAQGVATPQEGGTLYCPAAQIHRDEMAKFLSNSFTLPLYAP